MPAIIVQHSILAICLIVLVEEAGAPLPVPFDLLVLFAGSLAAPAAGAAPPGSARTYTNPLDITVPGDGKVESCADPSIIREQAGDGYGYVFCTTDPLGDSETAGGQPTFHLIPIVRSHDLVSWEYVGDAFAARPAWVRPDAGLWAPAPR